MEHATRFARVGLHPVKWGTAAMPALAFCVCSAFGACDDTDSAPEAALTPAERFYREYLALHSEALAACCPEIGPARPGEVHVSVLEWTRNPWVDGIVQSHADACLESMRAAGPTCAAIDARQGPAAGLCARVFRMEGDPAPDAGNPDCADRLECVPPIGARVQLGDPCSWSCEDDNPRGCDLGQTGHWAGDPDGRCLRSDGLFCGAHDECVPLLAEHEPCQREVQCGPGLFCGEDGRDARSRERRCRSVHAIGETCFSDSTYNQRSCDGGYCDRWEQVCKSPLPAGAECEVGLRRGEDPCGWDARCYPYSGRCVAWPKDDHSDFCVDGNP